MWSGFHRAGSRWRALLAGGCLLVMGGGCAWNAETRKLGWAERERDPWIEEDPYFSTDPGPWERERVEQDQRARSWTR